MSEKIKKDNINNLMKGTISFRECAPMDFNMRMALQFGMIDYRLIKIDKCCGNNETIINLTKEIKNDLKSICQTVYIEIKKLKSLKVEE